MKFGVCCSIDNEDQVRIAAESGFDYIECGFQTFANATEEQLSLWENREKEYNIYCESVNCFLPGSLPVTGDNVDYEAVKEFVSRGMKNCARMGVKIVVFGSSGARSIPEGYSWAKASMQMAYFLREIVSPIAAQYDITVVTEPLQKAETNMINTIKEGVLLALLADRENIQGLADLYHMVKCGDTYEDLELIKDMIIHAHISYPKEVNDKKRVFPSSAEEFDYKGFIDVLKSGVCERCSIEAAYFDFSVDAPLAAKVLKSL